MASEFINEHEKCSKCKEIGSRIKFCISPSFKLGSGGYGEVYRGTLDRMGVAIKRVPIVRLNQIDREREALEKMDHNNIIKLHYVDDDEKFRYYAMELCECSMKDFFYPKNKPKYEGEKPDALEAFVQLTDGLWFIREKLLFVHRDVKPENILFKSGQLKWSDFGLSKPVSEIGAQAITDPGRGSRCWIAPELLTLEGSSTIGKWVGDNWALGCIFFYYIRSGDHPFGNPEKEFPTQSNICKGNFIKFKEAEKQNEKDWALVVIKIMIEKNPRIRATLLEVRAILQKFKQFIEGQNLLSETEDTKRKLQFSKMKNLVETRKQLTNGFTRKVSDSISYWRNILLGAGFCDVYKGSLKGRKEDVAVRRSLIVRNPSDHLELTLQLLKGHENVVKLLKVEKDEDFRYFALELCDLAMCRVDYPTSELMGIKDNPLPAAEEAFKQMTSGLKFIHEKTLVHGNVRTTNLLILYDHEQGRPIFKWTGLSYSFLDDKKSKEEVLRRNVHFFHRTSDFFHAPELVECLDFDNNKWKQHLCSFGIDVWSLAVVFVHYLERENLPKIGRLDGTKPEIFKGAFKLAEKSSDWKYDMISKMLEEDQSKRIKLSEVQKILEDHPPDE